jgi:hypothetical protein
MEDVKCIITLPSGISYDFSILRIDGVNATLKSVDGKIEITRKNVITDNGINVFITLHGDNGFQILMDVYIGDLKTNKKPIEAHYMQGGNFVFNYNY